MTLAATSLKLPKQLKARITRLAKRAGESPHAFMLRVLEEQVRAAERFEELVADPFERLPKTAIRGPLSAWRDVKSSRFLAFRT